MARIVRASLALAVAASTAATVALAPAVEAPPPTAAVEVHTIRVVSSPVHLAAATTPAAAPLALPSLLADWLQRIVVPPSAGAPFPQPVFPPVIVGNSIDSTIKNTYNAVEPWVRYGFELATYAAGWVPYVGWLSPQIMIFYNFGERIARSVTFNLADLLGGNVNVAQGLTNVAIDTINSFIYLANDELAFFLPPLPPIPPIGPFAAADTLAAKLAPTDPQPSVAPLSVNALQRSAPEPTGVVETQTPSEPAKTPEPTKTTDATKPTESPTTTTSKGVEAQGEVRGSTQATPGTTGMTTTTTTTNTTGPGSTTEATTPPPTATPKAKDTPKARDTPKAKDTPKARGDEKGAGSPAPADQPAAVG